MRPVPRPLPLPLSPRARFAAIAAIVVALAVLVLAYQRFGPPEMAREHAVPILHEEVARFPLPPGSRQLSHFERDLPLYPPEIAQEYAVEMACLDVQRFYEEAVPAAGWTFDSKAAQLPQEVRSIGHKAVGEVTLNVSIECDQATPGFGLFFGAP